MSIHVQSAAVFLSVCLFAADVSAQIVVQQSGSGDEAAASTPRSGLSGGSTYVPEDVVTMLSLPQFAEELGLSEGQKKSLQEVRKSSQETMMKMWQKLREQRAGSGNGGFDQAAWKKNREAQMDARRQAENDALAVLSQDQKKRLQELRVQIALRNRGLSSLGTGSGAVSKSIGLTDEQKKQLNLKQREIREELQKVMAELKAEMEQEALEEVLTDSQLQTLNRVRGSYYEIRRPDYRQLYQRRRSVGEQVREGAAKIVRDVKQDFAGKKGEK